MFGWTKGGVFWSFGLASARAQSNDVCVGIQPAEGKGPWNSVNPFDQQFGVRRNWLLRKNGAEGAARN